MKIIASDYDGTLKQNGTISHSDINAIKLWQGKGNLFGIVTGRHLISIKDEIIKYNIPFDFVIGATGAIITDNNFNVLSEQRASCRCLKDIYNIATQNKSMYFCISVFEQREWYSTNGETVFKGNKLNDFSTINLNRDFHEIGIRFDDEKVTEQVIKKYSKKQNKYVTFHRNGDCIDITSNLVSKVSGINKVLKLFSGSENDLIVVGDNHNDIDMVTEFNGYAIKSGKKELIELSEKSADNIAEIVNLNL